MSAGEKFAVLIITLSCGASIGYLATGDIRRCLYWLFSAGIATVVTWR